MRKPEKNMIRDRRIIDKLVKKIVDAISPEKIILFGSYAYGNVDEDSDIDLLVIWDTKLKRSERMRCISRLIVPRPAPIDIVVKTPKEIEIAQRRIDPFLNEIITKGISVYARAG